MSEGEMPFYAFFFALRGVISPIRDDLADAMRRRQEWIEANREAYDRTAMSALVEKVGFKEASKIVAPKIYSALHGARPAAKLRATGILVTLQAIMEDLRFAIVGNLEQQFGPKISDVAFSAILQAGATSTRHGHEWWNKVIKALSSAEWLNGQDFEGVVDATWTKRQRQSIEVITKVLKITQDRAASDPAPHILALLSDDGNMEVLIDRMRSTARAIAEAKTRLKDFDSMRALDASASDRWGLP